MIDSDGSQLGIFPIFRALQIAREKDLDLVEVDPTAVPPTCRIMDYGKYRYEKGKRERRSAHESLKRSEIKELRLGIKISEHDLSTKIRQASRFLTDGNRVKITVCFNGREITHPKLGYSLLERVVSNLAAFGSPGGPPLLEGRNLFLVLTPKVK